MGIYSEFCTSAKYSWLLVCYGRSLVVAQCEPSRDNSTSVSYVVNHFGNVNDGVSPLFLSLSFSCLSGTTSRLRLIRVFFLAIWILILPSLLLQMEVVSLCPAILKCGAMCEFSQQTNRSMSHLTVAAFASSTVRHVRFIDLQDRVIAKWCVLYPCSAFSF